MTARSEDRGVQVEARCTGRHRGPQGPNEDLSQCGVCFMPTWAMRPDNEQIGLHAKDCSLERRHEGHCVGGGNGHSPTEVLRGWWPSMDEDVAAERARFANQEADR